MAASALRDGERAATACRDSRARPEYNRLFSSFLGIPRCNVQLMQIKKLMQISRLRLFVFYQRPLWPLCYSKKKKQTSQITSHLFSEKQTNREQKNNMPPRLPFSIPSLSSIPTPPLTPIFVLTSMFLKVVFVLVGAFQ